MNDTIREDNSEVENRIPQKYTYSAHLEMKVKVLAPLELLEDQFLSDAQAEFCPYMLHIHAFIRN